MIKKIVSFVSLSEYCSDVSEISKTIDVVEITAKDDKLKVDSKVRYGWRNLVVEKK